MTPFQRIVHEQEERSKVILKISADIPTSFVQGATDIIKEFNQLKSEIDTDVTEIVERVDAVKKKLTLAKFDEASGKGYLMRDLDEYFACFHIDTERLETLFDCELTSWNENLRRTVEQMNQMKEKPSTLLS